MARSVLSATVFALLVLVLVLSATPGASAFKSEEFKLCSDAGFCNRNRMRGVGGGAGGTGGAGGGSVSDVSFRVAANEAAAAGASSSTSSSGLTAHFTVVEEYTESVEAPAAETQEESDGQVVEEEQAAPREAGHRRGRAVFLMSVRGYAGGLVRVIVDEMADGAAASASVDMETSGRYHVPEVALEDKLAGMQVGWTTERNDATATVLRLEDDGSEGVVRFTLEHATMKMTVLVGDDTVLELNGDGMLRYEPTRPSTFSKHESFRAHVDTQPRGHQAMAIEVAFPLADEVYGIPERATSLALKPTIDSATGSVVSEPYRLYNLDVFEYLHESPFGLYGSIPMMVGHGSKGKTAGLFWLNASEMFVDVDGKSAMARRGGGRRADFIAESGVMDLFIFSGPSVRRVYSQLASAVGTVPIPPKFSLGYHQCRWNYRNTEDVYAVHRGFEEHDMPYDVLWLDIEHTDGKRYLTWDKNAFSDPVAMQQRLASEGRRMVTIVDPHVKRDPNYYVYKEALARGHFIRDVKKEVFDGWCWPGSSSYLDMLSPEVRAWWTDQLSLQNYKGSTEHLHIWNDMNEPSVFNGPEITMQKDNLHHGDVEHRDVHNLYGYLYHRTTAEGILQRSGGKARPFVLSRAFFMGTQRVSAVWTGDNTADWDHLKVSIPMLLAMNAAGLPFVGADVGGFFGNPTPELLARWYQLGTFYPFFRAHAHLETKRREPWLFGEPYTSLIRSALRRRYQLLAYIYTVFAESSRDGMPVMRSMWMEYPSEPEFLASEDQFMLGPALLVAPVLTESSTTREVSFPRGEVFYEMFSGKRVAVPQGGRVSIPVTMESVPIFARGGHIVPLQMRARRSTVTMEHDPYTLVVYPDSAGQASGSLYVDDGETTDYETGSFAIVRFNFANGKLSIGVDAAAVSTLHKTVDIERVVVMGGTEAVSSLTTGKPLEAMKSQWKMLSGKQLHAEYGPSAFFPGAGGDAITIKTVGELHIDTSNTSFEQVFVEIVH